jgi:hypothetical protein
MLTLVVAPRALQPAVPRSKSPLLIVSTRVGAAVASTVVAPTVKVAITDIARKEGTMCSERTGMVDLRGVEVVVGRTAVPRPPER